MAMDGQTRILIVDDDESSRRTLSLVLSSKGYATETAATGAEALEQVRADGIPFHVILLDIRLPDIQGVELIPPLKEAYPDVAVVMVTGYASLDTAIQALHQGAWAYVTKPVNLDGLLSIVQQAVERHQLLAEKRQAEARLRHINQVLRAVRNINQLIVRERDAQRLLERACQILVQARDYRMAWIGQVESGHKRVTVAARAGAGVDYLDNAAITWDDSPTGQGPTGLALKTRQPQVLQEIAADPSFAPWREAALAQGFHSSTAVPIVRGDRLYGSLHVYADTPYAFDAEEVDLLVELAEDLSFALDSIEGETRRREMEAELQESEERFRRLAENASDIIYRYRYRPTPLYEYVSPSVTAITGFAPEEFYADAQLTEQFIYPDDLATLQTINRGEVAWNAPIAFRIVRKDLNLVWLEQRLTPIYDKEGDLIAVEGIARDISERMHRQQEMETIAAISTALGIATSQAEMIPIILDQSIQLLSMAGAVLTIQDSASGETVIELGRGAWEEWSGVRLPPGQGICGRVIRTGQPFLTDNLPGEPLFLQSPLRSRLPAAVCVPLVAQGKTLGTLFVGREKSITEVEAQLLAAVGGIAANAIQRAALYEQVQRHAAELEQRVALRTQELSAANERLLELDRLKSKFVSDVSHELRTPITSILMYLTLVRQGRPEKHDGYLEVMDQEAHRLWELVDSILDLSRLEKNSNVRELSLVDMNLLVEQVALSCQARAEVAGLKVDYDLASELPLLSGVAMQLTQALTNLVVNAINYTSAGRVQLATNLSADGKEVLVEVTDTGRGIEPEDLSHIFDRFYRGGSVSQSNIPGTGLGLAIVKEIMDLHGGSVSVESQVGGGSTFRLRFPV